MIFPLRANLSDTQSLARFELKFQQKSDYYYYYSISMRLLYDYFYLRYLINSWHSDFQLCEQKKETNAQIAAFLWILILKQTEIHTFIQLCMYECELCRRFSFRQTWLHIRHMNECVDNGSSNGSIRNTDKYTVYIWKRVAVKIHNIFELISPPTTIHRREPGESEWKDWACQIRIMAVITCWKILYMSLI